MDPLVIVGGIVLLVLLGRTPPRISHWRGPQWGTRDAVQDEHLRLFTPPDSDEEE